MVLAAYPDDQTPKRSRKSCPYCEATPAGCRSNKWLRGQHCCEACDGDHDQSASDA